MNSISCSEFIYFSDRLGNWFSDSSIEAYALTKLKLFHVILANLEFRFKH